MPAKDIYHDSVRNALEKESWHITNDPFILIDIINDKIWIQRDGTEDGIANEFVSVGIPKDRIVLAFQPTEVRKYTDFAVTSILNLAIARDCMLVMVSWLDLILTRSLQRCNLSFKHY
ncbi:MAG: XisI protein [Nostoc sp. NMS2]|uniref:element excision factor XisI family protein n=1 Tax=Nostoc sp. NMS2 TaxID=2815389 RepID=UPI0034571F1C|nr:XisI protein [Nostoc sp. NMS2]